MMFRGQVISTDLLVAFAIFIFIADASVLLWQSEMVRARELESRNWAEEVARAASSQLLTPGNPSNWELIELNENSLRSFGLASSSNVIEWRKIERLRELKGNPENYYIVKQALGLGCCEVWFGVMRSNGTVVESFGSEPPKGSSSVSIDRKALLNSSPVTVRLRVWK